MDEDDEEVCVWVCVCVCLYMRVCVCVCMPVHACGTCGVESNCWDENLYIDAVEYREKMLTRFVMGKWTCWGATHSPSRTIQRIIDRSCVICYITDPIWSNSSYVTWLILRDMTPIICDFTPSYVTWGEPLTKHGNKLNQGGRVWENIHKWKYMNDYRMSKFIKTILYIYTCTDTCIRTYTRTKICTYAYAYMHAHTHIHTYIHIYTYAHTYEQIRTYVHAYTHAHTHIHTYISIYTYAHTYEQIRTYAHAYMHAHTHIHTYIYIYTRMHTHIHACNRKSSAGVFIYTNTVLNTTNTTHFCTHIHTNPQEASEEINDDVHVEKHSRFKETTPSCKVDKSMIPKRMSTNPKRQYSL